MNSLKESLIETLEKNVTLKGRWIIMLIIALLFSFYKNVSVMKANTRLSEEIGSSHNIIIAQSKKISTIEKEYRELKFRTDISVFKSNFMQYKHPRESKIIDIAVRKSKEYNLDPFLVMAVIQTESNFDLRARSRAGAYGAMQVNYKVWKDVYHITSEELLYDMSYNIDLGIKILKGYIMESHSNVAQGLYMYNNGYLGKNVAYVPRVMDIYGKMKSSVKESGL